MYAIDLVVLSVGEAWTSSSSSSRNNSNSESAKQMIALGLQQRQHNPPW
jgi:hypothetical protein